MIRIDYPTYEPMIKKADGKEIIFDRVRKRWVSLTPEEWVRQNFLEYLIQVLGYPASLIAIEKKLTIGEMQKRFDIVVYKDSNPFMIIECKEMNVPLTQDVLHQVIRYNTYIRAGYVVISNGSNCIGYKIADGGFSEIDILPHFSHVK